MNPSCLVGQKARICRKGRAYPRGCEPSRVRSIHETGYVQKERILEILTATTNLKTSYSKDVNRL